MRIDCDSCEGRGLACGDCVVTLLLGGPPDDVELDSGDRVALAVLADSGLVPPLRLQQAEPGEPAELPAELAGNPRDDTMGDTISHSA